MSLSTSFALIEATNNAMNESSVRATAQALMAVHDGVTPELFQKLLFEFSANLTAVTAQLVTQVFMSEAEIEAMMAEAMELDAMANSDE